MSLNHSSKKVSVERYNFQSKNSDLPIHWLLKMLRDTQRLIMNHWLWCPFFFLFTPSINVHTFERRSQHLHSSIFFFHWRSKYDDDLSFSPSHYFFFIGVSLGCLIFMMQFFFLHLSLSLSLLFRSYKKKRRRKRKKNKN
jgi:hypothetical protein